MHINRLLASTDYVVAQKIITDEQATMSSLTNHGVNGAAAAKAVLLYLDYLVTTWMPEPLWQSWSQKGHSVASVLLKIHVKGVLPTTNHLESFNRLLKRKYITHWQHSGSRLRFDFLICILITQIIPDIFASRHLTSNYESWLNSHFLNHAGGINLIELKRLRASETPVKALAAKMCWWGPHQRRHDEAWGIVQTGWLQAIRSSVTTEQYEATCISASSALHTTSVVWYELFLHCAGHGGCSCPDFTAHGSACKHLRALQIILDSWVQQHHILPLHYPSSFSAANLLCLSQPQPNLAQDLPEAQLQTLPPLSPAQTTSQCLSHIDPLIQAGPLAVANFFALQKLAGHDIEPGRDDDSDLGEDGTTEMLQNIDSTSEPADNEVDSSTLLVRFTLYVSICSHVQVN